MLQELILDNTSLKGLVSMKTVKKIISLLLAVIIVFGMLPAAVANTGNQVYISVSYDG